MTMEWRNWVITDWCSLANALLAGQPGTAAVVAEAETDLTVPGIADPVATTVFRGDSARLGYATRALLAVVT
jgi:hypothetical protein